LLDFGEGAGVARVVGFIDTKLNFAEELFGGDIAP
jgi:hypothetical protein